MSHRCRASIFARSHVCSRSGHPLRPGGPAPRRSLGALAAVIAGVLLAVGLEACQAGTPRATTTAAGISTAPRTAWGDPDLQGIWGAGYILTPLQRPEKFAGREFLTDEEVAALEREATENPGRNARADAGSVADVEGAYNDVFTGRGTKVVRTKRTSLIVDPPDGRIPPLTPEGQKRAPVRRAPSEFDSGSSGAASGTSNTPRVPYPIGRAGRADGPEDRSADRCFGITLPVGYGGAAASGAFTRMVQTPGYVTIYYEAGHHGGAYRIISLAGRPHLPPHIRQWLGDAVGHWEGETLVVDTTNFTNRTNVYGSRENLHLVERFTRAAPDMIMYRATIDDPTTFTRPWTLEVPLTKADEKQNQIFESACHEGNYALTGILAGARAVEREQAAKTTRSR